MPSDYTPETSFFHVAAGAVSERTGQLFHNYSSLSFSLFLLTTATRKQNLPKNKSLFVLLFEQKFYSQTSAFTFVLQVAVAQKLVFDNFDVNQSVGNGGN
jgi:hypothetical protein